MLQQQITVQLGGFGCSIRSTVTFVVMPIDAHTVQQLKSEYENSDCVWFLVDVNYRILAFNKKAAANSITFHHKEIKAGQSVLDYARDTKNKIDSHFIQCFGRAATNGKKVQAEERIAYNETSILAKSVYTPILENKDIKAISITVDYTTEN